MRPRPGILRSIALACLLAVLPAACTEEAPKRPEVVEPGVDQVPLGEIERHLGALDEIALAGGGTRAAGTVGYDASATYVSGVLEDAGYEVNEQTFTFDFFEQRSPTTLRIRGGASFEDGTDIRAMLYSESGSLSAAVTPVAMEGGAPPERGCDDSAFDGFASNTVALLKPGPCYFRDQVNNAQEAGASAVIFWTTFERGEVLRPTLLDPDAIEVPVLAVAAKVGRALSSGPRVKLEVDAVNEVRTTTNVIAESPWGEGDEIVMVGGHLDSVLDGPGINDNGSGVATILAVAQELAEEDFDRRLRVALWSGEELGLLGSAHYVSELSPAELGRIAIYLNFDMLASRNPVTHIYADDGSGIAGEARRLFEEYLDSKDLPHKEIDLEGRSDHGSFLRAGVPVGGLFSGADMVKSPSEAEEFGGVAGEWMDECYHQACDDITNIDQSYLDRMAEAITYVIRALLSGRNGAEGQ